MAVYRLFVNNDYAMQIAAASAYEAVRSADAATYVRLVAVDSPGETSFEAVASNADNSEYSEKTYTV